MPQLEVKSTGSPMADANRLLCLKLINEGLGDNEIKNLLKLVNNDKARAYLSSDVKFNILKAFIR